MRKPKFRSGDSMRKAVFSNDFLGPCIDSPADELLNDAWDAETSAERIKLARQVLDIDLDALDAYNLLGIHAATHAERIALFREGVRIGERLFAPLLAGQPVDEDKDTPWWGFIGTRPFMRAQHNLGLALIEAGDRDEAVTVFRRLLVLNPNDSQGIRMLLMKLMAESGDYGGCKILLADYAEDRSIDMTATALLVQIATKRKMHFPVEIKAVFDSNAHLLPLLATAAKSGKWPKRPASDMIVWGSEAEAALYLAEFRAAWERSPKFLAGFLEAYGAFQSKDTA